MSKENKTSDKQQKGNDFIADVMRSAFLSTAFPRLPYCQEKRGPSTNYNESFHFTNVNTRITLNFYWRNDGQITASTFNQKEKNLFKQYKERYRSKKFNSKIASKLCIQFLS